MATLATSLEQLPRVSRKILPALKRLGIATVRDLLFHLPMRYDDFSNEKMIGDVRLGEQVSVAGMIRRVRVGRTAKKHMGLTEITLEDETGEISAVWFHQPFLARSFKEGMRLRLAGRIVQSPSGGLSFTNPAHERLTVFGTNRADSLAPAEIHTSGLVAIYPETEGLSSRWLRYLVKTFLECSYGMPDPLPEDLRTRHGFSALDEVLRTIHFPKNLTAAALARRRLLYEKLLLFQLMALKERSRLKQYPAPPIPADVEILKKFTSSLPFSLTNAQRRSIAEITRDMEKSKPMNRLLEGDVGSGKTVVAAAAALVAVRAGYQVAFMAPTEILARQHFITLEKILTPFNVHLALMTSSERRRPPAAHVIVGTHALIQKNVRFRSLGLVVVDEQHRFGVAQRAALLKKEELRSKNDKGENKSSNHSTSFKILHSEFLIPHFLSMSATPIPRTMALTIYGDLDLSLLDEMPAARKGVKTEIVPPGDRARMYEFIRQEIKRGGQAFVVCPRIDPPEEGGEATFRTGVTGQQKLIMAEVKTVIKERDRLAREIFPDLRIAMLHGKLKPAEKEKTLAHFRDRASDILVATSVIEVGVDIPNATIMLIEGAERFGLAQLHQFRGRVGRGREQSYCFLAPTEDGTETRRLRAVVECTNGFELAEKDLAIRGAGELFGTRQSGVSEEILAAMSDPELVRSVRADAMGLIKKSPDLTTYPDLSRALTVFEHGLHWE
ncbi:MAG: ATP-dependent DNA helicase RecG [bacterium]|nr:ATP-dependent DNA helicase RecG [bacterium]MDZ4300014.1 ATP-dependent DNA helicase RecG [Candidatus Sungbacteria bacterium]